MNCQARKFGRFSFLLSSLFIFCTLCWSCRRDRKELIAETVKQRVQEFRGKKMQECRQHLLMKAEVAVDSILLAEAQKALQDSLGNSRPFRPQQPPAIPPIDSFSVSPLFKDSPPHQGN